MSTYCIHLLHEASFHQIGSSPCDTFFHQIGSSSSRGLRLPHCVISVARFSSTYPDRQIPVSICQTPYLYGIMQDRESRGCLGCCSQPREHIPVDEQSNRLRIQGRSVRKNSISEDFWSTSTTEMENSGVQSQKSISSVSTSNPLDSHSLLLWNQTRNQWLANKRPQRQKQLREPRISWNATYESLLSTNKPFPQPIPLPEMVDFLVDIWEQEGLYD
ncbi:hypothetical protein FF1_017203 [Malus domestica]